MTASQRQDGLDPDDLRRSYETFRILLDIDPGHPHAATIMRQMQYLLDHPDGAADDAEMAAAREFQQLLQHSSVGTPNARAIQRLTDPQHVAGVLRRYRQLTDNREECP